LHHRLYCTISKTLSVELALLSGILANIGTKLQQVDIDIGLETSEAQKLATDYVYKLWQQYWENSTTGRHLYYLQPTVRTKQSFSLSIRSAQVLLRRFRLGKCRLNYYLHQMSLHQTGNCDFCGLPETIEHYLIECTRNNISQTVKKVCVEHKLQFDLRTILCSATVIKAIYRSIQRPL